MKAAALSLVVNALMAADAAAQPAHIESAGEAEALQRQITRFEDIAPKGWCCSGWDAIRHRRPGARLHRLHRTRSDGREDFAVFRYDPATRSRRLLGSFMAASNSVGISIPARRSPRATRTWWRSTAESTWARRASTTSSGGLGALARYRGSHLYAYERGRRLEECEPLAPGRRGDPTHRHHRPRRRAGPSRLGRPGTPVEQHRVVRHARQSRADRVPGIPWRRATRSAGVVAYQGGARIYTYRGSEERGTARSVHAIWVHDLGTGENRPTTYPPPAASGTGKVAPATARRSSSRP